MQQIEKSYFIKALVELGHNLEEYQGKKLNLIDMSKIYEIEPEVILEAIEKKIVPGNYDYQSDTIWIDAIEAAYFYFCIKNEAHLYSPNSNTACKNLDSKYIKVD